MLDDCPDLKVVRVEDGCTVDVRKSIPPSVEALPPIETAAGNASLWDLRALRCVVIPEGVERIGNYWFSESDVESVEVPASVTEIGPGAFRKCEKLKKVTFAEGSKLHTIWDCSF